MPLQGFPAIMTGGTRTSSPAVGYAVVATLGEGLDQNGGTSSAIDTTGANLIVVGVNNISSAAITLSDSKGNIWVPLTDYEGGSPFISEQIFYCYAPIVGSGHTFTVSVSNGYASIGVLAFSGAASSPLDQTNGAVIGVNGTSHQPGSITPSQNNEVVVASISIYSTTGSTSIDSGFTVISISEVAAHSISGAIAYKIQTALGAENPTFSWTTVSSASAAIASFKAA